MFSNKTVCVTGGANGIGLAFTRRFLADHATVYVCDVNQANLDKLPELVENPQNLHCVRADVSEVEDMRRFFDRMEQENGGVDILINNAGINLNALIEDMEPETFDKVIKVNVRGAFLCSKYAIEQMRKKGWGRIINLTSPSGNTGGAYSNGQIAYGASKAALICMTKSLARETARQSITVNGVSPGVVPSNITNSWEPELRESLLSKIPMHRFGDPTDIANMAAYLCSDEGWYITGQVYHVDGGMWMLE